MKKFYKTADSGPVPGGYAVRLDGKPVKTPLKHPLLLGSAALAAAIAAEWQAQGDEIDPQAMPITQLANTLIDKAAGADRAEMEKQLLEYAGSDLVCYFASHPAPLVKKHQETWSPLLGWIKERFGIALESVSGIRYHHQPAESLRKLEGLIKAFSAADFTVVQAATAVTGSVVIALALLEGRLSPDQAYEASCVDEIYQLETWGEDELARKRLNKIKTELGDITRFRSLVRQANS